jgi:hypothetical protein
MISYFAIPMLVKGRSAYGVRLDGKVVGRIMPVKGGGYRYQPVGNYLNPAAWGDVFPDLASCQASLEGDA